MAVTIKEVFTKRDLRKFIQFPFTLYKNDPYWIPPLNADEYRTLHRKCNPAFTYCEARYFLAYKDDRIVGRIAGIINYHANSDWDEKKIRFGWFDFIDDLDVSRKLLDTVKEWGLERNMNIMSGPWGFSDMDKEGMLIEGFNKTHSITTLYNYPYYNSHMEALGFQKEVDWVQGKIELPERVPEKLARYDGIIQEKFNVSVIQPKKAKEIKSRAKEIFQVLNNSYVSLQEFSRLSDLQIKLYTAQYIPFVDKDLICVVTDNCDRVIGFAITMPRLSESFRKAGGRLFPFGFLHILWNLKRFDTVELYLIGVIPEYRNKGINALIFNHLHSNLIKRGVKVVISNPQLEGNQAVQKLFDYYDNQHFATRRCYFSHLSNQAK